MNLIQEIKRRVKKRFSDYKRSYFCYLYTDDLTIEDLLGISFDDYSDYIENYFDEKVNPSKGFHIDHIKPLSRALYDEEHTSFWHYTNTKPVNPRENKDKSNLFDFEYYFYGDRMGKPPIFKNPIYQLGTKGAKEHLFKKINYIRLLEHLVRLKLTNKNSRDKIDKLIFERTSKGIYINERYYDLKWEESLINQNYTISSFSKSYYFDLFEELKNPDYYIEYRDKYLENSILNDVQIKSIFDEWNTIKFSQ